MIWTFFSTPFCYLGEFHKHFNIFIIVVIIVIAIFVVIVTFIIGAKCKIKTSLRHSWALVYV